MEKTVEKGVEERMEVLVAVAEELMMLVVPSTKGNIIWFMHE